MNVWGGEVKSGKWGVCIKEGRAKVISGGVQDSG